ncbi:MAG: hypothetical protein WCF97_05155, partial [Nitrososphaeraceae archaeon]
CRPGVGWISDIDGCNQFTCVLMIEYSCRSQSNSTTFIHHLIEILSRFRNCISSEILCSEKEIVADHPQSSIRVG